MGGDQVGTNPVRLCRVATDADPAVLVAVRCLGQAGRPGPTVVALTDDLIELRPTSPEPSAPSQLRQAVDELREAGMLRGWRLEQY